MDKVPRHNLVFYRKYRPQTFEEVLSQEHVKRTIRNAIALGRVAHGYLFAGPRGTGKTTVARLIAKAVNCVGGSPSTGPSTPSSGPRGSGQRSAEPCNACELCVEVNDGRSLDLVEIDAASNRGIDEIRELREGIKFSPIKARYKVFIIDEAHMLTKEAANALLKILEEPPQHAIFILATTEVERLPATIISRTQRFDFRRIGHADIVAKLERIAEAEGLRAEAEVLRMIASAAEGSIRDAESLFAQVTAFAPEGTIAVSDVEEVLGAMHFAKLQQLMALLAEGDAAGAMQFIGEAAEEGYDPAELSRSLLGHLRKVMLLQIDPRLEGVLAGEFSPDDRAVLVSLSQQFSPDRTRALVRGLLQAQPMMKRAVIATLPLELAILEVLLRK